MIRLAKVCLITLPNSILTSPLMQAPLGMLYLGAAIEGNGHNVKIIDLRGEKELNTDLIPEDYDVYGVSATTGEYGHAKILGEWLKKHTRAWLMIGGAHATHKPVDTLLDTDYDIAVIGEGEITVNQVLDTLDNKDYNNLQGVNGITYRVDGGLQDFTTTEPRELIRNIDTIPFPARHLLPYDHVFTDDLYYGDRYGHGEVGTALMTERGCPYKCSYCANWDRKLRLRSIDNVAAEIEECKETYHCRRFKIVDDEFGVPRKRALDLCEALSALDIRFRAHTRADAASPELFRAMKNAGCEEVSFGIETVDQTILDLVDKRQTVRQCHDALKWAKEAGLRTKTYLMVCLPGETWQSIELTKQFMLESRPDKWTLSTCIPYPGSDMEKNPGKYGIRILERNYSKYWLYQDESMIETDVASREELNEHRTNLMSWLLNYDKINTKPV